MPNPDDLERLHEDAVEILTPAERAELEKRFVIMKELAEQIKEPIQKKPILCLDFDGVCHSYTSGWQGADVIPDPPVDGLFEFLEKATEIFDIQIFSSRSNLPGGQGAMWQWFCRYYTEWKFEKHPELREKYSGMEPVWISFPNEKPAAFIGIDDRVLTFNGIFPDMDTLKNFKPWNKK